MRFYLALFLLSFTRKTSSTRHTSICTKSTWLLEWKSIEIMRKRIPAPVDTMGATALSLMNSVDRNSKEFRFQTLLATMLSPQTKDLQCYTAFRNLAKLTAPSALLPSTLSLKSEEEVATAIAMSSFYITKAKNIHEAAKLCMEKYDDDIPREIDDLFHFKGVGPKVGYLTFSIAWNKNEGICVDTHVHRITNRLGWVETESTKSNGPEKTRRALETFIPRDRWAEINYLLVGFGQTICSARAPKCQLCTLTTSCKYVSEKASLSQIR